MLIGRMFCRYPSSIGVYLCLSLVKNESFLLNVMISNLFAIIGHLPAVASPLYCLYELDTPYLVTDNRI